jgi:hypothetical protein
MNFQNVKKSYRSSLAFVLKVFDCPCDFHALGICFLIIVLTFEEKTKVTQFSSDAGLLWQMYLDNAEVRTFFKIFKNFKNLPTSD